MAEKTVQADFRSFQVDVEGFAKDMRLSVNKASRSLAFAIFERVVQRTPRITGFLQAGWNLTIDKPDFSTPTPGKAHYFKPFSNIVLGAIGEANFSNFYIANGVPYSVLVDQGYPHGQAPAGIVAPALMDLDFTLEQLFNST